MLQGKQGVIFNGKKYLFSDKSIGSFVYIKDSAGKNENAQHHQMLSPSFVTLGHELGHSARMRGGGTTMGIDTIMEEDTGLSTDHARDIWQNSEELLNIKGFENR